MKIRQLLCNCLIVSAEREGKSYSCECATDAMSGAFGPSKKS